LMKTAHPSLAAPGFLHYSEESGSKLPHSKGRLLKPGRYGGDATMKRGRRGERSALCPFLFPG
jgi:hypothetical protein